MFNKANKNLLSTEDIARRIIRRVRKKKMSQEAGRHVHLTWHTYRKRPVDAMGAAIEAELQHVAVLRKWGHFDVARALLKSIRSMQIWRHNEMQAASAA